MRLEQEKPGNFTFKRDFPSLAQSIRRSDVVTIQQTEGLGEKERNANILFSLGKEKRIIGKIDQQPKRIKSNKFEPFEIPEEDQEKRLFVNAYHGHCARDMELNRKAIERILKIAHLDGFVSLTSLVLLRNRILDGVNADGSTPVKKFVFWGEKLDEEKDNPYSKVVSTPEGWRIQINDQRIMEELMDKKMDPKKRQKTFINNFNTLVLNGLGNCIVKEKLSSIKDKRFKQKLILSLMNPALQFSLMFGIDLKKIIIASAATLIIYGAWNGLDQMHEEERKRFDRLFNELAEAYSVKLRSNSSFKARKLDHPWEYIFPKIEIDKVIEAFAYLNIFGQKLVREKR